MLRIALITLATLSFGIHGWSQEKLPENWTGPIETVDGESREATVIVEGDRSDVITREFHLVRDNSAWQDLWHRHDVTRKRYGLNPIKVDFTTQMVVAVFLGRQQQVAGIDFYPVVLTNEKKHVTVRFRPQYYSFGGAFLSEEEERARDEAAKATPYGFVVLPRADEVLLVQAGDYVDGEGPPVIHWLPAAKLTEQFPEIAVLHGKVAARRSDEPAPDGRSGKFFLHSGDDRLELLDSRQFMQDELAEWVGQEVEVIARPCLLKRVAEDDQVRETKYRSAYAVLRVAKSAEPEP